MDTETLERNYREIQSAVHPDRFAHLSDQERRLSMQWATRVNEAYRTLRAPLLRAAYWLQLNGIDAGMENNTAMPAEFLMEQMEWREAVEEARASRDMDELDGLHRRLRQSLNAIHAELAECIDVQQDGEAAAGVLRRALFLDKLRQEIDDALIELES